jgi:Ca2+/Na+ antiporter
MSVKITISGWPLIGGILWFALFFLFPYHPKYLSLLGWATLACAYFVVLAQSYRKKSPVHTRGGSVQYEKQPGLYKSIYFLLFFAGVLVVLVLILRNLFAD